MDKKVIAGELVKLAKELVGGTENILADELLPMIMVVNDAGDMLSGDGRWMRQGFFGSGRQAIKMFRSLGQAKRRADEVNGSVVLIKGQEYSVEGNGLVIKTVPVPNKPDYVNYEHHKLAEFIVYKGGTGG